MKLDSWARPDFVPLPDSLSRIMEPRPALAAGIPEVIVNRLTGLFSDLELDRPTRRLLTHCSAFDRVPVGSNIFDPEADDVTASKLVVDRQIEERQVPCA